MIVYFKVNTHNAIYDTKPLANWSYCELGALLILQFARVLIYLCTFRIPLLQAIWDYIAEIRTEVTLLVRIKCCIWGRYSTIIVLTRDLMKQGYL